MNRIALYSTLALFSSSLFAFERGINYDPAHSLAYTQAQSANNLDAMKAEITKDLAAMNKAGFTTIKTFYSSISTISGQASLLADQICPADFKMLIGVYEFDPNKDGCGTACKDWTKVQIDNAIASVQKYPECIVGIAVGSEDIYNWNFSAPNDDLQSRISTDIDTIKNAAVIKSAQIPIGSAQQDGAWLGLLKADPHGIIPKLDFVGANIYPYWDADKINFDENAKTRYTDRFNAIKAGFPNKTIIVTEEGWPSQANASQNPNANVANETNYYTWWKGRTSDTFSSYYFGMFDKQDLPPNVGDADNFFGLCKSDNSSKGIVNCQ